MSTATDPHLRPVDSPTAAVPVYGGDSKREAALHPGEGIVPAGSPEWPDPAEAGHLDDPIADAFHLVDCACTDPYSYPGHAEQYAPLAEMTRKTVLAEQAPPDRGMADPTPPAPPAAPVKHPVEAKVVAGSWAALAATVVLAVSTAVLGQFDTFRPLFGDSPWSGPLVLGVGVVLTAAQAWAAYQAPHTPRSGSR